MTTFYVCRHGQTENNKNRKFSGWIDSPLTQEGIQHAKSSANKLSDVRIDKIISSDLGRAFATAYMISREVGYTAEIIRLSGLREVNYGKLANMPYESYPSITPEENTEYIPPDGESLSHLKQRVLACIDDICTKYTNETILIVGHDGTINSVRSAFSGETMGALDAVHNPHDFVAKFQYRDGKVISFDEVK